MFGQSLLSAFGSTACTTNNPNYPITNLAYYKMSNATDQLGNYNGTATNVNFNVAGKFGNAGEFNGTSSVISLGTSSSFSVGTTGSLSLSLWVKTTASSTGYLMSKANDSTGQYEWSLEYNGSQLQLNIFNTAAGIASSTGYNTTTINDGNWHHVAAVITNNTSVSLYIDNGTAATSSSWSGTTAGSFSIPTLIGHFGGISASTSYWEGDVDQVRIFSSALSAAQVTQLYNEIYCVPTIVPTDYFNPVLYTGNSSTQAITGVGFAPDFVWIKRRNSTEDHALYDSVRGTNKQLSSNTSSTEATNSSPYLGLTSFDSDGFTSGNNGGTNRSPNTYVAWSWKAGGNSNTFNVDGTGYSTASAAGLTTGSLTPTGASVNTVGGFSIIKLNSGSSTADVTVSHGLGVKPSFVLFKKLNSEGGGWFTWSSGFAVESYYLYFQDTYGFGSLGQSSNIWGNQSFTSDVISFRSGYTVETNRDVVIYAWAEIPGYSKMGTYTGTGTTGNTIVTGFKPAWVMIKNTNSGYSWVITDDKRTTNKILYANLSQGEDTTSNGITSFDSNGFTLGTAVSFNQNTNVYIFMAFAE